MLDGNKCTNNTIVMRCFFHTTLYILGKICTTSDKTTTTKTTSKKKKHRQNQKKHKNLGFQGKVLAVTSPKSQGFFGFLEFFFFVFFVFFGLLKFFSEVLPLELFISDFAQIVPFSTELCAR